MDTHTTANVSFDITHFIFVDLGLKTLRPVNESSRALMLQHHSYGTPRTFIMCNISTFILINGILTDILNLVSTSLVCMLFRYFNEN